MELLFAALHNKTSAITVTLKVLLRVFQFQLFAAGISIALTGSR